MPGRHDLFIYKDDQNRYRVEPAVLVTTPNQTIRVRNCTGEDAVFDFPAGVLSNPKANSKVPAHAKDFVFQFANKDGHYNYSVNIDGQSAIGASSPSIIIDA
jgi:hypothetical protein